MAESNAAQVILTDDGFKIIKAQNTADNAASGVTNLNDPNLMSVIEKQTQAAQYAGLTSQYNVILERAKDANINTTDLTTAYTNLNAFMAAILTDTTKASDVDRKTYKNLIDAYNIALSNVQTALSNNFNTDISNMRSSVSTASQAASSAAIVASQAAATGDSASQTASSAASAASAAQSTASSAVSIANNASQAASDAVIIGSAAAVKGDKALEAASQAQIAGDNAASVANNATNIANNAKSAADSAYAYANSEIATQSSAITKAQSAADNAFNQAQSAITTANSTASEFGKVSQKADNALSGALSAQNAASEAVSQATSASSDSKDAKQIAGAVSQSYKTLTDGSTMTIAELQNGLATKLTKNDLDGYATQNWTQNQIEVTANGINETISSVKNTVDGQTTSINDLKADSDSFKSQFTTVNDTLSKQNTDIGTLQATSKELTTGFNTLTTDNTTNKNDISQLKQTSTEFSSTLETVQTQVQNSAVGTNLLIGTATPVSIKGNNSGNQVANTYALVGGMTAYALYQKYGSTFALSYDWSVTDTASAYAGGMQQQFNNNPWGFSDFTTFSSSNKSGHKVTTFTLANNSANTATTLEIRLDNVPTTSTITVSNMKLEKGSLSTDWCPNPADNATVTALSSLSQTVDGIKTDVSKKIEQKDLNGYATEDWTQSQIKLTADGISGTLSSVKNAVDSQTTSINDLKADSSSFKSQFTTVNNTLGKHTTDISTLQSNAKSLSANFDSLNTDNNTNKRDISQLQLDSKSFNSTIETVQTQVNNSAVGTNLAIGTNQEYSMGYGIPTTTWKDGYAYEKLPTTIYNGGEILPQGPYFYYTLIQGVTYTQTIWFETDATVKDLSAAQITWFTNAGHDGQPARVQKLGQNSYKITSTYTWPGKSDNNVRLFDMFNLNSAFDLSTGTYLKFGKLKLEKGGLSTDWCLNPVDIATQSQFTQLSDDMNLRVKKGELVDQINLQAGKTLISSSGQLILSGKSVLLDSVDPVIMKSANIGNMAVGTAQIANGAITNAQIGSLAVGTANIKDAAINSAKIANLAVGTAQIGNGAITNAKIANLAVGTAQIANAAITDAQVGNVSANKLTAGTIDFNTITGKNINASNITTGKLSTDRLDVSKLSAVSADLGNVTTGSLKGVDIVAKTFSTPNGSFTTDANGAVVASNLTIRGVTNLVYNAALLGGSGSNIPGWNISNNAVCWAGNLHDGVPSIGWNNTTKGWNIFAQTKLHPLNGATGQPYSASVWFKEYGSDTSLTWNFTLAFFDSNGNRLIYPATTWNGIGSEQDWRYVTINNVTPPSNAVSVGLQYWTYNGHGNGCFSSPMLTQTAQSTGYQPDTGNVVSAGEIDGSVINGSTINGATINTPNLQLGTNGTLNEDWTLNQDTSLFNPKKGSGTMTLTKGLLATSGTLSRWWAGDGGYWYGIGDDGAKIRDGSNQVGDNYGAGYTQHNIFDSKGNTIFRAYMDATGIYMNNGGTSSVNTVLTQQGLTTTNVTAIGDINGASLTTNGTFKAALGTKNTYGFSVESQVVSPMIRANSYTYSSNVFISSYGTMGLATSTKANKLDIVDVPNMLQKGYNLLTLNPRQWFDKTSVEAYADVQSGNSDSIESVVNIKPVTGMVAEEVASAGLDDYVVKDENNKVQGLAYDRLWTLLLPVLRDMNDKINKLQKKAGI